MIEKISAVTLRVANMEASVRFYKDVLGLEIVYGGESSHFTSLRTKDGDTILNLEHGNASIQWGRLIFHVSDVDHFWEYLNYKVVAKEYDGWRYPHVLGVDVAGVIATIGEEVVSWNRGNQVF
jgi:catechol 2,3-dioxygenase-like lactoylglutathione lyase family enzyme